jgi:large subunit ribosomal protein L25
MARQTITLSAERRSANGKGAARQLRMKGRVPAIIYGHGREAEALSLGLTELEKALMGVAAQSTIFDLTVDGAPVKTLIREIQRHPFRPGILHVDFYEIHADEKIKLEVPIHLTGAPDGVRNGGGTLDQVLRTVTIEVLPAHIPERVEHDVTELQLNRSVHVRDLVIPNVTVLTNGDLTVCTITPPRAEEVVAVAPEAAAEAAAAVPEPELIRKPKPEDEAEAEEV